MDAPPPASCYNVRHAAIEFDGEMVNEETQVPDWKKDGFSRQFISQAESRYPSLFRVDPSAIPINVKVNVTQSVNQGAALVVYICTLCIVGGITPSLQWSTEWQVDLHAEDVTGNPILSAGVKAEDRGWWSILTPFGLMDCPGESDAPKVSGVGVNIGPGIFPSEHRKYVLQCLVDRLAADLLKQDAAKLPRSPMLPTVKPAGSPSGTSPVATPPEVITY